MVTRSSYCFFFYTIISNKGFLTAVLFFSFSQYLQKSTYSSSNGMEGSKFEIPTAESTVFIMCLSELIFNIICISSENITPENVFRLSDTSFTKNTRPPPPERNKGSKLYYHSKRSISRNTSSKNIHLGKESELWISSETLHHIT